MAEGGGCFGSDIPVKRRRFHLPEDTEAQSGVEDIHCFTGTSVVLPGPCSGSGECSLADSGFNELTPPRSMEDQAPPFCLKTADRSSSLRGSLADDSTNDSSVPESASANWVPEGTNDDDDDNESLASTTSRLSCISNLSSLSGREWKPCAGPMSWVQQQMQRGTNPRSVLSQLLGNCTEIPPGVSDITLWRIVANVLSEPPRRQRLRHVNTIDDVIRLIKSCRNIVILTGAGVSVSCGIPDFRSRDGIYARLAEDFPNLPDPQAMFDIQYFRRDPRPFFKFAREIYPGQFTPSLCHRFIRLLEQNGRLLRNYTQNIDTLEQVAGIENVIQCHGSFATATCLKCLHKVDAEAIRSDIFDQRIPYCVKCVPNQKERKPFLVSDMVSAVVGGSFTNVVTEVGTQIPSDDNADSPPAEPIMKPDIVFFGEGLSEEFHDKMAADKDFCDLLIVVGSSLKVRPVALIPSSLPSHVPQILINRESLRHMNFDVELLGDCDIIINMLCQRLGESWKEICQEPLLKEITHLPPLWGKGINDPQMPGTSSKSVPPPRDETDMEALRACWEPKVRKSLAQRLPENSFFYNGAHRYVFPGAEVFYDPDDSEDDSSSQSEDSDDDTNCAEDELTRLHEGEEHEKEGERVEKNGRRGDEDDDDWTNLSASLDASFDHEEHVTDGVISFGTSAMHVSFATGQLQVSAETSVVSELCFNNSDSTL